MNKNLHHDHPFLAPLLCARPLQGIENQNGAYYLLHSEVPSNGNRSKIYPLETNLSRTRWVSIKNSNGNKAIITQTFGYSKS